MKLLLLVVALLLIAPIPASAVPQSPYYLHEFLPGVDDLPDGFLLRADGRGEIADIAADFPTPADAERQLIDAGWSENAYRQFSTPDGSTSLEVSAHRFADHEAASEMAPFLASARAERFGLSNNPSNAIGGCSVAIEGEIAQHVDEYTIVLCLREIVFRITSISSATDPESNALTAAQAILDRFASLPGGPPAGAPDASRPTSIPSTTTRTTATLSSLWDMSQAMNARSSHAGSPDDPVPPGESLPVGPWRVAVIGVVPDGDTALRFHNRTALPAAPGYRFVLVEVGLVNDGEVELSTDRLEFAVANAEAARSCPENPPFPLPYGGEQGRIEPGGSTNGYLCLSVRKTDLSRIDLIVRPTFGLDSAEDRHFALR